MSNRELNQEWYTISEVESLTGILYKNIDGAIRRGSIINYKIDLIGKKKIIYLHRDVVNEYLDYRCINE